ncbi:single-stranded DNA-binding protein [Paenarthrobacter ilicis]|uniref:single-stranded DNA-binding protein n=1 Tax=Paenarthrobacter ilicis TaxID=43665 RepID=UPI003008675B
MNDIITVRGFVASEVKTSTTPRGTSTATFRLGTTERRFDRATNTWVDGNTNWYSIQSFRYLAAHVGCSIKKGQRVMVVGKLRLRQWEHEGRIYHVAEIDAESVGHDLMWGSANFTRMNGSSVAPDTGAALESSALDSSGSLQVASDWGAEYNGEAPSGEYAAEDLGEDPDGGGSVLVDTSTGELVGSGV